MGDDRDELADTLAEAGRRLGQALTGALERIRPALDSVAGMAGRPEIRGLLDRAEQALRLRPCLCLCSWAHPADQGICETMGAVILERQRAGWLSDWLGELDVPLCAPCAAARAAGRFGGLSGGRAGHPGRWAGGPSLAAAGRPGRGRPGPGRAVVGHTGGGVRSPGAPAPAGEEGERPWT